MNPRKSDATNLQKELLDTYEQASRAWLERMKSEMELWAALATKMSGTRSVPEALEVYQKGLAQRMQMAADDGQKLFDGCRNITQQITRAMSDGLSSPGSS